MNTIKITTLEGDSLSARTSRREHEIKDPNHILATSPRKERDKFNKGSRNLLKTQKKVEGDSSDLSYEAPGKLYTDIRGSMKSVMDKKSKTSENLSPLRSISKR